MSETTNKKRVMALSSLRRRAATGDAGAMADLARVLASGELGKPDPVAAWVAFSRAVAAGHPGARAGLMALAATMSATDLRLAERELSGSA